MAFKLIAILSLASLAIAGPVDYQGYHPQPAVLKAYIPAVVKAVAPVYKQVEHEAPAEYEFSYAVHDEHTGDIKSQKESRKGDAVEGYYELIEPDGHRRIVHYTADAHNGFNAVVQREDSGFKVPQPAPQIHKIIAPVARYVAPVAKVAYAAPVGKASYSPAPVAKVSYSAPVAHYSAPAVKVATKIVPGGYHSSGHENSHVTFSGPSANYHY